MSEAAEQAVGERLAHAIRTEIDALPADSKLRSRLGLLLTFLDRALDMASSSFGSSSLTTSGEIDPSRRAECDRPGVRLSDWATQPEPPEPPSLTLWRLVEGPPDVIDGARLVDVELWEDRVEVNLVHVLTPTRMPSMRSVRSLEPGSEAWRRQRREMFGWDIDELPSLADDVGTRFSLSNSGSHGSDGVRHVRAAFRPPVPSGVSRLEVTFGGRRFSVPL